MLVREWIDEREFGGEGKPAPWFVVPKRPYLPDGRAVPVCTVLAPPVSLSEAPSMEPIIRPQATFGGGLPPHVEVQHEDRFATIGCLVADGHTIYALTARHASGELGTPVSARLRSGARTNRRRHRQTSRLVINLPERTIRYQSLALGAKGNEVQVVFCLIHFRQKLACSPTFRLTSVAGDGRRVRRTAGCLDGG